MITFKLEIIVPSGFIYKKDAEFLKIKTSRGDIGIYARHENYVSSLGEGEMYIRDNDTELYYFVTGGFLEVREDKVIVLAEDVIEASNLENAKLEKERIIKEATSKKIKEEQDLLGTKKKIQESLRR